VSSLLQAADPDARGLGLRLAAAVRLRTRFKMGNLEGQPCSRPSFGLLSYGTFTVNATWFESEGVKSNVFTSSWLALQFGPLG
jgi:hypothetical protein